MERDTKQKRKAEEGTILYLSDEKINVLKVYGIRYFSHSTLMMIYSAWAWVYSNELKRHGDYNWRRQEFRY